MSWAHIRLLLGLALTLNSAPAIAGDDTDPEVIGAFTNCAGYWAWMAKVAREQDKPATEEFFKGYKNGARFSALWLLARDHNQRHLDDLRPPARFAPLVDGPIDIAATRAAAMAENGDEVELKALGELCVESTKAAGAIIEMARENLVESNSP